MFAVQDEITTAVATAIVPAVAGAELRRALRKLPENLSAWEAYQRGLWHLGPIQCSRMPSRRSASLNAPLLSMSDLPLPHASLAMAIEYQAVVSGVLALDEGLRLAEKHARTGGRYRPGRP